MNPVKKAETIISLLDIKRAQDIDIELISNYFDINIKRNKLDGASARLLCIEDAACITVSNSEIYERRIRFSIAHELGHFFLHRKKSNIFSCSEKDMFDWNNANIESEANIFAANILMPENLFKNEIKLKDHNIKLINETSNIFSTSITSTLIRVVECSREPCALVCIKDGIVAWVKKNKDFSYFIIGRNTKIAELSYAHDCLKNMDTNLEGRVPVGSWINDDRVDEDATLFESTFVVPSQRTIFSLLWLDKDVEKSRWN